LEQLQLPDQIKETYFKSSEIKKLAVYKQKKIWHFYIQLESVLPFEIYRLFFDRLRDTFREIANVKLTLQTSSQICSQEELINYWNYFIHTFPNLLPTHTEILKQEPKIEQSTFHFNVKTDAEAAALKRKVEKALQQFC